MTRASSRVLDPSDYYDGLPATLWKSANLPRLPSDAPAELKKHTIDVNDPKKVYVLYRAQRRHGFQDLVQRYYFSLPLMWPSGISILGHGTNKTSLDSKTSWYMAVKLRSAIHQPALLVPGELLARLPYDASTTQVQGH